ncbi:tripartite motif-containing protein 45 [Trichonephila clavata]|uniref:Tripartite motif-containing protein 45 n=1 Tax=Trichonephila clavata TaxID=2740835 RepID=A0A8X6IWF7_TRICU|nr:tripartite motif-containing protein 45 [Trichonephila clavata]
MEYILKYTLDSTTLKLEKISDISSTSSILIFRKKFSDVKTLRLFTKSVSKSTFFPVFNIPYDKNKTLHNVLYCEVAVGDSIFVTKEYAKNINPPDHYASFIVNENDDQVKLLHNENIDVSEYSYVIKDQSRILPLYEITFEYDEELEKKAKECFCVKDVKKTSPYHFALQKRLIFVKRVTKRFMLMNFTRDTTDIISIKLGRRDLSMYYPS